MLDRAAALTRDGLRRFPVSAVEHFLNRRNACGFAFGLIYEASEFKDRRRRVLLRKLPDLSCRFVGRACFAAAPAFTGLRATCGQGGYFQLILSFYRAKTVFHREPFPATGALQTEAARA